jgi:hypothetical protein
MWKWPMKHVLFGTIGIATNWIEIQDIFVSWGFAYIWRHFNQANKLILKSIQFFPNVEMTFEACASDTIW